MSETEVAGLTRGVLGASFGLSVLFGALLQRTHFCTMGAVSDLINLEDSTRLRMWALAVGVAVIGFQALVAFGGVQAANTVYAQPRMPVLALALGGWLFGVGMVLASGCGSKTLVRIGGGNLKSLVVLIVMGVAALAMMRGVPALARVNWIEPVSITLASGQDLPSLTASWVGLPVATAALGLAVLLGGGLCAWGLGTASARRGAAVLGGVGVGGCVVALWWVSGVWGFVPEHPETLEPTFLATNSRRMESFSMVGPAAYVLDWLTYASDTSRVVTVAMTMVPGVILGSWLVAWRSGEFRWESFRGTEDLVNHLVGAVLMGLGGVLAVGCTIGQGLSGLSTLSIGSGLATAFMLLGGWSALRYQIWRVERMV
jgi:uncharacterized protein